jgi:hypothetical protein
MDWSLSCLDPTIPNRQDLERGNPWIVTLLGDHDHEDPARRRNDLTCPDVLVSQHDTQTRAGLLLPDY